MEIFIWAFIGGIFGAVLMDITETYAAKLGVTSGVNVALVGRWFLGLLCGKFVYSNILEAKSVAHEVKAGWLFHLLIGGGGVALLYPLFLLSVGFEFSVNHLWWGMLFGLLTSILPWFILLPSFGWGLFGRRGPQGSNALLASTLSHIPYGLGVGLIINLCQSF
jgi:hypothetical protein